jgi:hypothetical protein
VHGMSCWLGPIVLQKTKTASKTASQTSTHPSFHLSLHSSIIHPSLHPSPRQKGQARPRSRSSRPLHHHRTDILACGPSPRLPPSYPLISLHCIQPYRNHPAPNLCVFSPSQPFNPTSRSPTPSH